MYTNYSTNISHDSIIFRSFLELKNGLIICSLNNPVAIGFPLISSLYNIGLE